MGSNAAHALDGIDPDWYRVHQIGVQHGLSEIVGHPREELHEAAAQLGLSLDSTLGEIGLVTQQPFQHCTKGKVLSEKIVERALRIFCHRQ